MSSLRARFSTRNTFGSQADPTWRLFAPVKVETPGLKWATILKWESLGQIPAIISREPFDLAPDRLAWLRPRRV